MLSIILRNKQSNCIIYWKLQLPVDKKGLNLFFEILSEFKWLFNKIHHFEIYDVWELYIKYYYYLHQILFVRESMSII